MFVYIDTCVYPGAHRDQKRVLDSLELELQIVVNHLPCGFWVSNLGHVIEGISTLNH